MPSAPLLSFENVARYRAEGRRRVALLHDASFELAACTAAGIWGVRRSGKTTLLRLAAAIELADEGRVLFAGRDVARMRPIERERLLRSEIGFVSPADWRPAQRERVLDYVALPALSTGATLQQSARAARAALRRAGAVELSESLARTLSLGERLRTMLARALIGKPRLLIVDEPAAVPGLNERDELCELLGSLARERELSLLIASEEMSSLRCADFLMSIGSGELVRSDEQTAQVLSFPDSDGVKLERPAR